MTYPTNPNPYQVPTQQTSTTAIISLISGILSWFLLPLLAAIVAVITGHIAKKEIKNSNGMIGGNGMATAGLILGYIQIGLVTCGCIVVLIMMAMGMTIPILSDYSY